MGEPRMEQSITTMWPNPTQGFEYPSFSVSCFVMGKDLVFLTEMSIFPSWTEWHTGPFYFPSVPKVVQWFATVHM